MRGGPSATPALSPPGVLLFRPHPRGRASTGSGWLARRARSTSAIQRAHQLADEPAHCTDVLRGGGRVAIEVCTAAAVLGHLSPYPRPRSMHELSWAVQLASVPARPITMATSCDRAPT